MNFLAHLLLSGSDPEIKAGNLFGDEVKGRKYEDFPSRIKLGILLHRHIDSFTDEHPLNMSAKTLLHPDLGKYAGVALDIYYDHFLAKHWSDFSHTTLENFTKNVYDEMELYIGHFSEKSSNLFYYMKKYNWIVNYREMDGIEKTFEGMYKRIGEKSGMNNAFGCLEKHYQKLESYFLDYFPLLASYSDDKLLDLSNKLEKNNN